MAELKRSQKRSSDIVKRSLSELVVAAPLSNVVVDLGEERIA